MKKFIVIFCISFIVLGAYSQNENSSNGKTKRELKKEQLKAEKETAALSVEQMVSNQQFYLEVTHMSDQSRAFSQSAGMNDVSSQINYIAIDSNKLIMQLEPNAYLTTNWGIDNLPIRGILLQYKLTKFEKSGEGFSIHFRTTGAIGEKEITMTVSPMGKTVLRMLKNNGETLTFRGTLIPLDQSRISSSLFL